MESQQAVKAVGLKFKHWNPATAAFVIKGESTINLNPDFWTWVDETDVAMRKLPTILSHESLHIALNAIDSDASTALDNRGLFGTIETQGNGGIKA